MNHHLFCSLPAKPAGLQLITQKTTVLLLTCLLFFSTKSKAVVTTHEIALSYKGYSIEKLPGKDEFVAVGTFYHDDSPPTNTDIGYHVMHLDATGHIINNINCSSVYPNSTLYRYPGPGNNDDWEIRVVDVAVVDADNIWVVMSVRKTDAITSAITDFIYAEKVSLSACGLGTAPNKVTISNVNAQTYKHLYPTSSVYSDDNLYICGYSSNQTPSVNIPTNTSLEKKGILTQTYVGPSGPTTNIIEWDTQPVSNNAYDYDMALRIRQSIKFPNELLLTGAANGGTTATSPSGVLAMRVDMLSLSLVDPPAILTIASGISYPPDPPAQGMYGMDIYEKEGDPEESVYILSNTFENNTVERWGIIRVNKDLTVQGTLTNYLTPDPMNYDWGKEFLPDPTPSPDQYFDLIVSGERIQDNIYCYSIPYNPPSANNVNPFQHGFNLWWDPFNNGINWTNPFSQIIHESVDGTTGPFLDYFTATPTVSGTNLEDVTRLYTFAVRFELPGQQDEIALITPLFVQKTTSANYDHLNSKFLRLTNTGHEPDCSNEWTCSPEFTTALTSYQTFPDPTLVLGTELAPPEIRERVIRCVEDDCFSGHYKHGKTTGIENVNDINGIKLYPNPASTELNIDFGKAVSEYDIIITDMAGKQVIHQSGSSDGGKLTLQLSGLSSGMYITNISADGVTSTAKVTIE